MAQDILFTEAVYSFAQEGIITMIFNSYMFILFFLPATVFFYTFAGKYKNTLIPNIVLLAASYAFVAYAGPVHALILLVSTVVNYLLSKAINAKSLNAKSLLIAGICFNIVLLGYFKYTGFLMNNIASVLGNDVSAIKIIFPIGISFYTFQQIAFLVDTYRKEVPEYSLIEYFLFTAYFPKVIQGPIVYHNELMPEFKQKDKKKFDIECFSSGLMLFAIGLSKKVLIADNFGKIVDYGFGNIASLNSFEAVLVIFGYTLQIYFDFSGYCDMAVGISKMMNIDLPMNFNSPYKALNITDFWKRWHITLTRFLTKYIYIPLGGNRKGKYKTYLNIMIVFIISGIWHGAGYTFIIWGAIHGVANIVYRLTGKTYDKIPRFIQWFATFIFVSAAWVFFRAGSASEALSLFGRLFAGGYGINAELAETLLQPTVINVFSQFLPFNIVATALFLAAIFTVAVLPNSSDIVKAFKPTFRNWAFTLFLLLVSILSISGVSTFLYSNF